MSGKHRLAALSASACMVAASMVALPGTASGANTSAQAAQHLVANLRGTSTGDPNGTGRADLMLNKGAARICATVTWHRIGAPNAAHIHRADGTVVVDLTGSVTGGRHCTHVGKRLIQKILDHPRRYYFNVHNLRYPAGAIRGALHR